MIYINSFTTAMLCNPYGAEYYEDSFQRRMELYRFQYETLRLKVGEILSCGEDKYVFADEIVVLNRGRSIKSS